MNDLNIAPGTIWITGLCASGKTTLGKSLYEDLMGMGVKNVEFFDGEDLRQKFDRTYGYSPEERLIALKKMIEIVCDCNKQGKIAIISVLSHKKKAREYARRTIKNFMEIHLDCPVDVCAKRDFKDHYRRAFAGEYENFIGVTEPYEVSDSPELEVDTASNTIEESSKIILQQTLLFLKANNVVHLEKKHLISEV